MDFILMLKAAILGVVEGLTEFLPISSTGHLIITRSILNLEGAFWQSFDMAIQVGAIIAVVWEFRERIAQIVSGLFSMERAAWRFVINVLIACVPAVAFALLFEKQIKGLLFNAVSVAIALVVGGLIILWAERRQERKEPRVHSLADLTYLDALKVGVAQIAAIVPGTSRSGSTIIGGMLFGLSRKAATEFSFFLAIPILFGASVFELNDLRGQMNLQNITLFVIGFVFSFISAFICVRWLLRFVSHNNFKGFAWYRIAFGLFILLSWSMGWLNWSHA
ncbi:MAG: undecaprenyl-diphosphate phosphatase [Hydromonas sp.]|jgi:undecaprenyl-diphosphatase|nr:undecaprenyl-diphosphate phosphatase [Hydromonas sp.]